MAAISYYFTPIQKPLPPYLPDELPEIHHAVSATAKGFDETTAPPRLRPKGEAQDFIKLFFSRFFNVTDEQITIANGTESGETEPDQRKFGLTKRQAQLFAWNLRTKAFGPESYIFRLVKYKVMKYDFEVVVFNMLRYQRLLEVSNNRELAQQEHAERESPQRAILRRTEILEIQTAVKEHLSRYHNSLEDAVEKARTDLTKIRVVGSDAQISSQTALVAFLRQEAQDKWTPDLAETYDRHRDVPPKKLMYAEMLISDVQQNWIDIFHKDEETILTNILWPCKDKVAIIQTLEQQKYGKDFAPYAFATICHDLYRFSIGPQLEEHRMNRLLTRSGTHDVDIKFKALSPYRNIETVPSEYEPDFPRLGLVKVPQGAVATSAKRRAKDVRPSGMKRPRPNNS